MRLSLFGVAGLAVRRLRSRPVLTILSLLGIVLAVGMVVSVPVFAQAVSYLVLHDELADMGYSKNRAPLTMRIYYELRRNPVSLALVHDLERRLAQTIKEKTGLSVAHHFSLAESPIMYLRSAPGGPVYTASDEKLVFRGFTLLVLGDVENHIRVIEGQSFADAERSEWLPVWAHQDMANTMGLQTGERYHLFSMSSDQPIRIYIAGIWSEGDQRDRYWGGPSIDRRGSFLVTAADYEKYAEPFFSDGTAFNAWYFIPDEKELTLDKVDAFAYGLEILPTIVDSILPTAKMDVSPIEPMRRYATRRGSLNNLLVAFSLPAVALLFYFLALLSTVIAQFQREEMAIMAGRGAGWLFLVYLILAESVVLIAIGLPLGLLTGRAMAWLMGQTTGFLALADRPGFPISLQGVNWRLLAAVLLLLVATRLLPAINAARKGVVVHLREWSRPAPLSWAIKLAVDAPLIIITAYAYRQLRVQEIPSIVGSGRPEDVMRDPLLLIAPLLCLFTSALVLAHIFPIIMRPLDTLSKRLPSFALYIGLRRLYGQSSQYTNALFLVIICLSLGSFYSSMALSVDQWLHDRIYYAVGADYAFRQGIATEGDGNPDVGGRKAGAWVLPITDYLEIDGVEHGTRVGEFAAASPTVRAMNTRLRFLGIERLTFPQVAFYRPDFAPISLGELLNRLGQYRNGLLVTRQFLKNNNLLAGQKLPLDVFIGNATIRIEFVIVGTYDYFPTAFPRREETLIGNLDYLFEQTGDPSNYKIWLKTEPTVTTEDLERRIMGLGVLPLEVNDARALLRRQSEQEERIGIFGVLSIGFVAGSVLSWLGLLVYTSASMQGRMQQIGVLKAIGVQTHEALLMEGVEYLGVIAYGIIGGVAAGALASHLFVPFFQFNVTATTALPPFMPLIDWTKIRWFAAIFAVALLLSEGAILYQATRKDIFQALRMGQRE